MKLKNKYKYAIATPTSMGVRITPLNRMSVHNSNQFYMQATSAETNVLNVSSSLGYRCLALTKFVEGSPIALFIQGELRKRNIDYVGKSVAQGGPWGYRHQFNIADSGYGYKASRVWNDRAGEVGRTLQISDFDTKTIFEKEGVAILHISGLIASMSKETTDTCVKLAKIAKKNGTLVSFDLNYRATFWKGREEELHKAFHAIASQADILCGNEEDFQLCLGFEGPKTGGDDLNAKIDSFKEMITLVQKKYKNAKIFATTLREVLNANRNLWGVIANVEGKWFVEEPREIEILDRIGGGDGFMGGFLYGILKKYSGKKCVALGWAGGALAASSLNDYAEPADEKQLMDIYAGNARVQR
ncbi:MAG: hypothetical protein J6D29_09175 [Solobacterium sp.]|nr:hypothetical protein [Solobacterium sp.]